MSKVLSQWCSNQRRHLIKPRQRSSKTVGSCRTKIAEKSKLLSQLEQAKMQEEMNSAMSQLTETVGDDVPTLSEVTEKIEARYAESKGPLPN